MNSARIIQFICCIVTIVIAVIEPRVVTLAFCLCTLGVTVATERMVKRNRS